MCPPNADNGSPMAERVQLVRPIDTQLMAVGRTARPQKSTTASYVQYRDSSLLCIKKENKKQVTRATKTSVLMFRLTHCYMPGSKDCVLVFLLPCLVFQMVKCNSSVPVDPASYWLPVSSTGLLGQRLIYKMEDVWGLHLSVMCLGGLRVQVRRGTLCTFCTNADNYLLSHSFYWLRDISTVFGLFCQIRQ